MRIQNWKKREKEKKKPIPCHKVLLLFFVVGFIFTYIYKRM